MKMMRICTAEHIPAEEEALSCEGTDVSRRQGVVCVGLYKVSWAMCNVWELETEWDRNVS